MARAYFPLFFDQYIHQLSVLDDASAGRLFKAVLRYAKWGEVPDLPGMEKVVWAGFRNDIDTSIERYEYRCMVNAANGAKGGRPRLEQYPEKPNGFDSPQTGATQRQYKAEEYKADESKAEEEKKEKGKRKTPSKQNQKKEQAEKEEQAEEKKEEEEEVNPHTLMTPSQMRPVQMSAHQRRKWAEQVYGKPWDEISIEDKQKFYTAILCDDISWDKREKAGLVEPVG